MLTAGWKREKQVLSLEKPQLDWKIRNYYYYYYYYSDYIHEINVLFVIKLLENNTSKLFILLAYF